MSWAETQYVIDEVTQNVTNNVKELLVDPDVFGFIEHCSIRDSDSRIEYIGANKGYTTPLTVNKTTHTYSLGSWATFPILVENKPWMVKPDGSPDYRLSETDYFKKEDGVTDSDVANASYVGGAFSKLIRIYRKEVMNGTDRIVMFSFEKKDGFTDDGFDGVPCRWIPMFYGSIDGDGKAQCIADTQPSYGKTTDQQHTAITNFHADAKFLGGAIVEVIIDLLIMFAKTSDLEGAYGNGNMSGYDSTLSPTYGVKANAVVGGGQFYGSADGKSLNKIFHSIVLGSYQQWMRDPYEVVVNGKVKVSKNYAYDPTGASYDDTGIRVADSRGGTWRYPLIYIPIDGYGAIPDQSSEEGSTTTGPCDGTYSSASQSTIPAVLFRFGDCTGGLLGGPRARYWAIVAAYSYWNFGFAVFL